MYQFKKTSAEFFGHAALNRIIPRLISQFLSRTNFVALKKVKFVPTIPNDF